MGYNVDIKSLIYPLFVKRNVKHKEEVSSMPDVYRFSPKGIIKEAGELNRLGINKVILFGIAENKDESASGAFRKDNIVAETIVLLKKHFPDLTIITDVCLCAYTSHGHCAILDKKKKVSINKRATLSTLAKIAVLHAAAGADYVAPSAMAKGQVRTIRRALDKEGYTNTKIMGYSAKFASGFYGPFRDAALSAPSFGDRSGYQLNYKDRKKALLEVKQDIAEGADIVMVKPAISYLDIIRETKNSFTHPLAAYNVSGEYAMVKAGASLGYWNEREMVFEILTSIKRAGADLVITYHARDIAKWLK